MKIRVIYPRADQRQRLIKILSMSKSQRKNFNPQHRTLPLPDLIEVQKRSYTWFFEKGLKKEEPKAAQALAQRERLHYSMFNVECSMFDVQVV